MVVMVHFFLSFFCTFPPKKARFLSFYRHNWNITLRTICYKFQPQAEERINTHIASVNIQSHKNISSQIKKAADYCVSLSEPWYMCQMPNNNILSTISHWSTWRRNAKYKQIRCCRLLPHDVEVCTSRNKNMCKTERLNWPKECVFLSFLHHFFSLSFSRSIPTLNKVTLYKQQMRCHFP